MSRSTACLSCGEQSPSRCSTASAQRAQPPHEDADGPVGAEHQPLGAEGVEQDVPHRADVVEGPAAVVGLGDQPRDLAHRLRMRGQRSYPAFPVGEFVPGDGRLAACGRGPAAGREDARRGGPPGGTGGCGSARRSRGPGPARRAGPARRTPAAATRGRTRPAPGGAGPADVRPRARNAVRRVRRRSRGRSGPPSRPPPRSGALGLQGRAVPPSPPRRTRTARPPCSSTTALRGAVRRPGAGPRCRGCGGSARGRVRRARAEGAGPGPRRGGGRRPGGGRQTRADQTGPSG